MKDFIPEGEDAGSPSGKGGYRDFVPQEEIDAKKAENEAKKEALAEEKPAKKGGKKAKKEALAEEKPAKKGGKKAKKVEEVPSKPIEETEVEKPVRGKKHQLK